jgi:Cytochrome c oxidase subunit IV
MTLRRRLVGLDEAQETRVFLLMSAFGLVVGIVYWFLAYEVAGTVLLVGFGVATGIIGARLTVDPASRQVRSNARDRAEPAGDAPGGGTGGIDRPFADETGRLPTETIAPFAVGLGVAVAATALIFGPAPLIVGALPVAWGAASWLRAAREELDATELDATELDATELERDSDREI